MLNKFERKSSGETARRAQEYLTRAAHAPRNMKIAAGVAAMAILATAVFGVNRPSQKTTAVLPEAGCQNQTWPYIDQTCADAMKVAAEKQKPAPPREVRVIGTDATAPPKVVLAPAPEPGSQPAAKAEAAVQPAAPPASDKPLPAQTVAATPDIGSDKDAFVPATAITTPSVSAPTDVQPGPPAESSVEVTGPTQDSTRPVETLRSVDTAKPGDRPRRSRTATQSEAGDALAKTGDTAADPQSAVVQERVIKTDDGRTLIERRVYHNVKPDPAYQARRERDRSSATYTRTIDDED